VNFRSAMARFRLNILIGPVAVLVIAVIYGHVMEAKSVHSELTRLQRQSGLTFAWADTGDVVRAILFQSSTIVDLKDSPSPLRPKGFSLADYPPSSHGECWSHDQSTLASIVSPPNREANLIVLNLKSKRIRTFAIPKNTYGDYISSQCWSADAKKLTYDTEGSVRLYEPESDRSNILAKGTDPSWSPDGQWIGFRDGDIYYAIHPDGSGRKELFRNRWGRAVSALYWSPDSRIVTYVRQLNFFHGTGVLVDEVQQLRVRRLEDGSEARLCSANVSPSANYQWINIPALMKLSANGGP
jgi:hypothetical protein